jgi:N6-L-threonylcarbamoyladenine synthase
MYVLGIETSCDETAASVVVDGKKILSNEVASSLALHKKFGGIIPEIAFRMQLETISEVTEAALKKAKVKPKEIGLISVTCAPGLLGSLFVGVSFAKALALGLRVPLVGVNHIISHIYAALLENTRIDFPFVALVVSGGHTSLFYVKDFIRIELLGSTQDDACGEAFDKVAKILDLGYPGGPLIEKMAAKSDSSRIKFNCSGTKKPLDFSFSGIKTAVLYTARPLKGKRKESTLHIAASFQKAVIDTLVDKSLLACKTRKAKRLVAGGGVVANGALRAEFMRRSAQEGVKVFFPSRALSTDNAAMVAGLGYVLFKKGIVSDLSLSPDIN